MGDHPRRFGDSSVKIHEDPLTERNERLIALLEQIIAEVRKYGAQDAHWMIDAENCGTLPFRYRLDTVINRGVVVKRHLFGKVEKTSKAAQGHV